MLALYPAYEEPTWKASGRQRQDPQDAAPHVRRRDALYRVAVASCPIDLTRYATLPFLEKIDPAIKSRALVPADIKIAAEGRMPSNRRAGSRWCEAEGTSVCIQSRYKLEGKLPIGIMLLNKIRDSEKNGRTTSISRVSCAWSIQPRSTKRR